jgi:hypothetical protein
MRFGIILLLFALGSTLVAQSYRSRIHHKVRIADTTQLHQLIMLDYSKLLGVAMDVDADSIYFQLRSSAEVSAIPLEELRFLGIFVSESLSGLGPGPAAGFADLTYERTALPYHTGAQLKVVNIIYSVVEWNLNKNIQLGVGLAGPLGLLATQRFRFSLGPGVHLGFSNQLLTTVLLDPNALLGDSHVMLTVGNEQRFFNLGTGILFNTDAFDDTTSWAHRMAVGGKVGNKWHFYSEVLMVLSDNEGRFSNSRDLTLLPSFSGSLAVRSHRWKFGLLTVLLDEDSFFPPPIPYIGYAYYWGRKPGI